MRVFAVYGYTIFYPWLSRPIHVLSRVIMGNTHVLSKSLHMCYSGYKWLSGLSSTHGLHCVIHMVIRWSSTVIRLHICMVSRVYRYPGYIGYIHMVILGWLFMFTTGHPGGTHGYKLYSKL